MHLRYDRARIIFPANAPPVPSTGQFDSFFQAWHSLQPHAADPDAPVVVVDSGGKEIKLKAAKMTAGFHRLAWLADPKGTTDDARKGPLALELRGVVGREPGGRFVRFGRTC